MRRTLWGALGGALLACSSPQEPQPVAETQAPPEPAPIVAPVVEPEPVPIEEVVVEERDPTARPRLMITDRAALGALEAAGFDFGSWVLGEPVANTSEASKHARFAALAEVIEADLEALGEDDPKSGVGMAYSHRRFDPDWLNADIMRFRLIAVAARLDRLPFAPEYCGEVRLIYRLEYDTEVEGIRVASPLPMTINVVSWAEPPDVESGCQQSAERWLVPDAEAEGATLAARLLEGPLAPERGLRERLKSVEVNMQSVRWPSTVRPDMAGHAEYILRVFTPDGEGLKPAALENTPDVARLSERKAEREALLAWLKEPENLSAIDMGVAVLPDRFLAKRATSVSPRGLTRHANRPFAALYAPDDFADVALDGYAEVGSPVALLRKLDGMSCMGCHQGRSVAGFHVMGEEPAEKDVDALAFPFSPHVADELGRREAAAWQHVHGEEVEERRSHAERTPRIGGYGEHCGLGDPGLAAWVCDAGLECVALEEGEVGLCLDAGAEREVGEPCETGRYKRRKDRHRDRIRDADTVACAHDGVCEVNEVGFPGGMCAVSCSNPGPHGVCGGIPLLTAFNRCIARRTPFADCIRENARPAGLRGCDVEHPCREDYVCARLEGERGACMPPYFLFQLRVDGHPL